MEIIVVIVIIGLLAAIAIPAASHLQRNAQNKRFVSDLRAFAQAFETYAAKNGAWPADANRGVVPPGMSGELRDDVWKARNSLSGQWDWDYKQTFGGLSFTAGISTVEVTADDAQMAKIDAMIDDGNLATGNFVKALGGRFVRILEK